MRLIIILAVVGGLIAFIGDKLGSKIGKKKLSVFGLRPYYTSVLMTVITGVLIAATTIIVMAISSDSARTAMFGMERLQDELSSLNREKAIAAEEMDKARAALADRNKEIQDLDGEIEAINAEKAHLQNEVKSSREELGRARAEVNSLSESKATLEKEVNSLEATTERLRRGIVAMREGDVVYRSGEVIYAGVLSSKLADAENAKKAAEALGIECIVLNAEALAGQDADVLGDGGTPLFAALLTAADKLGMQYVATAHRARVETGADGVHTVCPPAGTGSDDSTILAALPQETLARLILPLGDFAPEDVAEMAEDFKV